MTSLARGRKKIRTNYWKRRGGRPTQAQAPAEPKLSVSGQFVIAYGCTVDHLGQHYVAIATHSCVWCGRTW
jgi:hypothetical protein